jgi:PadR family transcriptional regulator, regulatory protein PadR
MAGKYDDQMVALLRVLLKSPSEPRYSLALGKEAGFKPGHVQPALARLERMGLVASFFEDAEAAARESRPRRGYYHLVAENIVQARQFVQEHEQRPAQTSR